MNTEPQPQAVDRSRLATEHRAVIKRVLARLVGRRHSQPAAIHATSVLCDGTAVHLRAIRPDDKEPPRIAFARKSRRSVYGRFIHRLRRSHRKRFDRRNVLDFCDRVGLVHSVEDETGERLIAVGRFIRTAPAEPSERSSRSRLQTTIRIAARGRLPTAARRYCACRNGVRELVAHVLEDNREMLEVIRGQDFRADNRPRTASVVS